MTTPRLVPGRSFGRYELLVPVGRGGMAEVWAARQRGSRGFQKIVAFKVMLPYLADDPNFERMFLDEASLTSQVRHPNVIEILDLGEQEDVLYLVMEWVDGEPLNVILETLNGAPLPLAIATGIAAQTCAGLHAVHELRGEDGAPLGLVHRDVSPQNLLVGYDGAVKVVDFGVAKATLRLSEETKQGQLKGKFAYMAPEQLRGELVDRRSDVFALGAVLYTMATGRHPFKGDNEAVTITNVASDEPAVPPSEIVIGFPPRLEAVIVRALAKDRTGRFDSMDRFREAIVDAVGASSVASMLDVARFVTRALPDRRAERRAAIKRALDDADSRGPTSQALEPAASADATLTRAGTSVDDIAQPVPPKSRALVWLAAVAALGLVVAVGTGLRLRGRVSGVEPAVITSAIGAAASASAASDTVASASASPVAASATEPQNVAAPADAGTDAAGASKPAKRSVRRRVPTRRTSVKRTTSTAPPATATAASPPTAPTKPIKVTHDPGF